MRALRRAILGLGRFNELFAKAARLVALSLVGVMTAAVLIQVLFRYAFNSPISWTEEFSIFSMIWMAFLVAPIAYRSGANVSIGVIRDLFEGRAHAVLPIVLTLLILAILLATGVIEGTKNGITDIVGMKSHEHLKFITLDGHAYMGAMWMMNNDIYESMPDDTQALSDRGL